MNEPTPQETPEDEQESPRGLSLWKRVLLFGAVLLLLGGSGAVLWLKSTAGESWLRKKAEEALNDAMASGRAEIVGLSNGGLGELAVEQLTLLEGDKPILELHGAEISVRLFPLLRGEIRVGETSVDRVVAELEREAGRLNLLELFDTDEPSEESSKGASYSVDSIQIDELELRYREEGLALLLEEGSFAGGVSSVEDGIRLTDIRFQGLLEDEPVSLTLQEAVVGAQQFVQGLQLEGMDSRVQLSGAFSEEKGRVEVQEAVVGSSALKIYLGEDWNEELRVQGTGVQNGERLSLKGTVKGVGGSVEADLQESSGLVEGRLSLSAIDLHRIRPDLGEEAVLTGELMISPSPREAMEWALSVDRLILREEVVEGLEASGVWTGKAAEQVSAELRHESGTVDFQGNVEPEQLQGRVSARLPSLGELERLGVSGVYGGLQTQGLVSVDWSEELAADFDGTLLGTQMGFPGGVAIGSVEGPLTIRYQVGNLRAEGGVKGQQGQMDDSNFGAFFGGWQLDVIEGQPPQWEADVEAEALEHFGLVIGGVSAGFQGIGSTATGRVDLENTAFQHLVWPSAEAVVEFEDSLVLDLKMKDENQQSWRVSAQQTGESVALSELQIALDGVPWSLSESVQTQISSEVWDLPGLTLQADTGETLEVGFQRSAEQVVLELEAAEFPLAALNTALGKSGHSGHVSADLRIEKQEGAPVVAGRISGRKMLIPGSLHGARLDVEFLPNPEGQRVDFSMGRGKKALASGKLVLPMGDGAGMLDWQGELAGKLLLMPSDNRVFENVVPGLPELPKGWTAAELIVGGTLLEPRIDGEVGFEWMLLEGPEFFRGDLRLRQFRDALSVEGAIRQSGRPIMRTKGNFQTGISEAMVWLSGDGDKPPIHLWDHWWQQGQIRILAKGMEVATVRSGLPFEVPLDGLVSGSILIEGKPSSPRASVGLSLSEGRMGEVELPVAMISVNAGDEGYEVFSYSRIGEEELRLEGTLGIDLDSDRLLRDKLRDKNLALTLNGAVPLAVLEAWTPRIDSGEGAVVISGELGGSLLRPEPKLKLGLDKGRLDWLPEGIAVQSVSFAGEVDSEGIQIPRFAMKTAPIESQALTLREHKSRITGSVVWPFDSGDAASLELSAEDAWLAAIPGRILRVDGGISAEGTPQRMDLLGSVVINEGRYELTPGQWLSEDALMLDPAIHLNRRVETMDRVENQVEELARWHYAMDIDLGQNTWIDAEIPLSSGYGQVASKVSTVGLEGRLEGLLQASGDEDGLLLQGEVDVRKGKAKVFGTDFGVETGALVFSGASLSNPELDIRAVYASSQYGDIRVDIGGRPAEMTLAFSSTEGWSDTDMASILLFRMPASSMTQSEGGAGLDLIGAAIGVMAGQASSFLQMSRVVDRVEVESTGDAISAIRLGWSVGDDLFVTFTQDYTAEMDENQSEVTLEWLLSRRLQAEVSTGDAGESSADLYMRWRF